MPALRRANAMRLLVSATWALIVSYWVDLGATGLFIGIALGIYTYVALTVRAIARKQPLEGAATRRRTRHDSKGTSSHALIIPLYFAGR